MVKKISGRAPSLVKSVATGVSLTAVWTLGSAAIIAKMLENEVISMNHVGYGAMAAVLSAVFMGATLAGKRAGHMVVQAAALSGAGYFVCLLLVNALFFGGTYTGMGTTLLLIILATALALLAAGKGRGRHSRHRYKIPKA